MHLSIASGVGNASVTCDSVFQCDSWKSDRQPDFGNPSPNVPNSALSAIAKSGLLLHPDEAPNFVDLDMSTIQMAHFLVEKGFARFSDAHAETHELDPPRTI
jgi:hypothetical protein